MRLASIQVPVAVVSFEQNLRDVTRCMISTHSGSFPAPVGGCVPIENGPLGMPSMRSLM